MLKHMPKLFQSGKRVARALMSGLLLATILVLVDPSSSYLAIEQPHVGFGAFLAERSAGYPFPVAWPTGLRYTGMKQNYARAPG